MIKGYKRFLENLESQKNINPNLYVHYFIFGCHVIPVCSVINVLISFEQKCLLKP